MTDAPAAFQATYSDWKLIRSRKVVQIVFEVGLEQSGHAYDVLGGMPNPGAEAWFAIAALDLKAESEVVSDIQQPTSETRPSPAKFLPPARATARQQWHQMRPSQQAGLLCNEEPFWKFLNEERLCDIMVKSSEAAAYAVRTFCGVLSRAAIVPENQGAFGKWAEIVSRYRLWQRAPEWVG